MKRHVSKAKVDPFVEFSHAVLSTEVGKMEEEARARAEFKRDIVERCAKVAENFNVAVPNQNCPEIYWCNKVKRHIAKLIRESI